VLSARCARHRRGETDHVVEEMVGGADCRLLSNRDQIRHPGASASFATPSKKCTNSAKNSRNQRASDNESRSPSPRYRAQSLALSPSRSRSPRTTTQNPNPQPQRNGKSIHTTTSLRSSGAECSPQNKVETSLRMQTPAAQPPTRPQRDSSSLLVSG
jgi:hypothetical protein